MSTPGRTIPPVTDPQLIPIGDWWKRHWQLQATCSCGRVSNVHPAELLKRYGDNARMDNDRMARLAPHLKCIRCGARSPKLKMVREG